MKRGTAARVRCSTNINEARGEDRVRGLSSSFGGVVRSARCGTDKCKHEIEECSCHSDLMPRPPACNHVLSDLSRMTASALNGITVRCRSTRREGARYPRYPSFMGPAGVSALSGVVSVKADPNSWMFWHPTAGRVSGHLYRIGRRSEVRGREPRSVHAPSPSTGQITPSRRPQCKARASGQSKDSRPK